MKQILLSALVFLLLIGCKKDNKEIAAPITQPTCNLTSVSAAGNSYLYQYDAKEKLSNFIDPFNPPIKFFYDANNRLTKIHYYQRDDESAIVATEQIEYN